MGIQIDDLVEITLLARYGADAVMNVFQYDVTSGVGEVEGVAIAEAWWNFVKDEYRGIVRSSAGYQYRSVILRELNDPTGVLVEWNIPTAERQGTRAGVDSSEFLPPFNAASFRMTVGTRTTRPGQKRIGGMLEVDSDGGLLSTAYTSLLDALAAELCDTMTLASPASTFNLTPIVVHKDATGAVTAYQEVVGYVLNPAVSSQVSRKIGRGM